MHHQKRCEYRHLVQVVFDAERLVPVERDKRELYDPYKALTKKAKTPRMLQFSSNEKTFDHYQKVN